MKNQQQKEYFKYSRTSNGGWLKEKITQKVYPVRIEPFDCIALKNTYSWEVRELNTFVAIVNGNSQCIKTRKSAIEEAKKLIASRSEDDINLAIISVEEYKIKFARLPINQEVQNLDELLTHSDREKLNWINNVVS